MSIDSGSVILMMAVHLLTCGALFMLAARKLGAEGGFDDWGLAAILLGGAYLGRLAQGLERTDGLVTMAMNATMLLAVLMLARGFLSQSALRLPLRLLGSRASLLGTWLAISSLNFGAAAIVPSLQYGIFAMTLTSLCSGTGIIAMAASRARRTGRGLRLPVLICGVLLLALGLLGGARAISVVVATEPTSGGMGSGPYFAVVGLAMIILSYLILWVSFAQFALKLRKLAHVDALTGTLNRNGLDDAIRRHFRRPRRDSLVLLQVDVDHFKAINDRHGHATGDLVLADVGTMLRRHCRSSDFVARTGGEEFLVVCAGAHPEQAYRLAESLRERVKGLRVSTPDGDEVACTVSIGVSTPIAAESEWQDAWHEADLALYRAKALGRDRTETPLTAERFADETVQSSSA